MALVRDVLWSEVKGRTAKGITREIVALLRKAQKAHAAVVNVKRRIARLERASRPGG